ncbi:MAG: glycosyltransferase [Candidatus Kuenenia stuttgartiensis]|nr:glycosyltransferase [Candidatus Kuenenia stuttgartiensis]
MGTEASKGDYIAFLDADDLWKPQKLEVQIDFMEAKGYPFTFSFYDAMDEDGNLLKKLITAPNPLSYSQLLFSNYVGNLTGIYSTKYFGRIPISSIRKRQDWILWLTILKKMKVAYPVPESLAFYRMHDNSISSSKVGLLKFNYLVYRHFGKSALIASLYMLKFLWIHFLVKPKYSTSYL